MMHPSTKKLLDRLAEMTRQRRIGWQETSSGTGVAYAAEGYTVHLIKDPQTMQLSDANGAILEDVTSEDIAATQSESGQAYTSIFEELFREASRQARGTERAIDTVLAGLDLDGDGIPDIEVPSPTGLQPTAPTSDASACEDVADESGSVGQAGAFGTAAVATGAAAYGAATGAIGDSSPSSYTTEPQTQAAPEPDTSTFETPTDATPSTTQQWGEPYTSAETPVEHSPTTEATEDSASNVGEAVANMANEVNSGEQSPPRSSDGILGGGSFGNSGFGGFGSQFAPPAPPADPEPVEAEIPADPAPTATSTWGSEAATQTAAEPQATTWPSQTQHEPAVPTETVEAQQTSYGSAPTGTQSEPQLESPVQQEATDPFGAGSAQPASSSIDQSQTARGAYDASATTSNGFGAPAATPSTYEEAPAQATYQEPVATTPDAVIDSGLQSEPLAASTPDWSAPAEPAPSQTAEVPQVAETQVPAAETSRFGQAIEQTTQSASTFIDDTATQVSDAAAQTGAALESSATNAWGAVEETASSAGAAVSDAAQSASSGLSNAASSLAGAAATTGQGAVDTASQAAGDATNAARSILGGATARASGAVGSLASAAAAATGAAGQAVDGVANKLNPMGGASQTLAPEGEDEDGQGKPKPLTRFNPWS